MKLSLIVLTPGKTQGKAIPVTLAQFLIGRDPQCHLRPASPIISNRHCAVLAKDDKVVIRDFESTNGTFVNGERVKGQKELKDNDVIRIGPLEFRIQVEAGSPPAKPKTPAAAPVSGEPADDEAAAALLLSLQEEGGPLPSGSVDSEGVPTGSTVMDMPAVPAPEDVKEENQKTDKDKGKGNKTGAGDTASAADTLLQKYLRRSRKTS
jgi:pSer/pThr/pTyr-binding forkhead associated (FHA) protein